MQKYIPSYTKKYDGKFKIVDDKLVYVGEDEKEIKWCEDLNILTDVPFNAEEWDKIATDESCFKWGSNTPGEDGYNVIIGYNASLENYPKVRIPSRCQRIICDGTYYDESEYGDAETKDKKFGRSFLNNIQKIELPETITEIGNNAFGSSFGNGLKSVESIAIPNSVTSIEDWAFEYCSSLTNIIIPDSVTSIGSSAFTGCSNLTSITIPNSVMSIGSSAFSHCSSLTNITIPNSVTSIGDGTFFDCTSLTNITISNSITYIGHHAFSGCGSLINIQFLGTMTDWNNISKGNYLGNSSIKTITCTDGTITL